jgi:hypothetical protein
MPQEDKLDVERVKETFDRLSLEDQLAITSGWKATNARRTVLIEKKISRQIILAEEEELAHLQHLAGIKRELVAPLPLEELEQAELLAQLRAIPNPKDSSITHGGESYSVAQLIEDIENLTPHGLEYIGLWKRAKDTLRTLGKGDMLKQKGGSHGR